jgi:hypothetical protein
MLADLLLELFARHFVGGLLRHDVVLDEPTAQVRVAPRSPNRVFRREVVVRNEALELLTLYLRVRLDDVMVHKPLAQLDVGPGVPDLIGYVSPPLRHERGHASYPLRYVVVVLLHALQKSSARGGLVRVSNVVLDEPIMLVQFRDTIAAGGGHTYHIRIGPVFVNGVDRGVVVVLEFLDHFVARSLLLTFHETLVDEELMELRVIPGRVDPITLLRRLASDLQPR